MRCVPDIAAVEIERLRADGIEPTDDEVVWLASLGRAVETPDGCTREAAGLIDGLRLSDGTILCPLTLYAERWLKKYGNVFRGRMELAAVGYAMAHELDMGATCRESVNAVKRWLGSLRVSPEELARAVSRMIGDSDQPEQPAGDKIRREDLIGFLVAGTGLGRRYWENEPWIAVDRAHVGLLKYAAMVAGTEYDPDKEASRNALKDLGLALIEIRKSREES